MQDNHKMNTLSERMNQLKVEGYTKDFDYENQKLVDKEGKYSYSSNEVEIDCHYRFEGESDPGDLTVLYAMSTRDGQKGLLVDGYGSYSDTDLADFIRAVT